MLALLALCLVSAAPAKHGYTVRDQVALKRVTGFEVSPDGSKVAIELRTTDYEANKGQRNLWLVNADGAGLRQLTTSNSDASPEWSPDSKSLYFLSSRAGTSQVYRLSLEGGEPTAVTRCPLDVTSFNLSPSGNSLAFSAQVFADCDTLECTKKKLDEQAKSKATGRVYDQLFVRAWDSWLDGRRDHLFVQSADGSVSKDLMRKMLADTPSKVWGGREEYAFTPDGKSLVFTARDVGREEAWSTDYDLFLVPIDASAAPKKLTTQNRATDTHPVFSPDGKTLAYLAMTRPGFESDKFHVVLRSWPAGTEKVLTAWDRSPEELHFSADGKTLYVTAWDLGQHGIFALELSQGVVSKVFSEGHVSSMARIGDKTFFALDTLTRPSDLYSLSSDGKPVQLTRFNDEALAQIKLGTPEQFTFAGWNNELVHAYLVKPVDFDPKKKYPLAFLIHGGPQGSFGNDFHYRWNPQVYAGRGYATVMIDFHGSVGYGQAFTDSISQDWGGKPLEDLQKGLAAALSKYPFIDSNRVCALGASYGGYMVNYIAGVWNAPFKCLVVHDGNLDERLAYFNTEELWFPEWEHGGLPWEKQSNYGKHNPIDHLDQWKVPMLVIHGGRDYRVVDTQGLSTFTALQRRGIPSKMLYFPDENHWVLKPQNSVLWHDTVLGWLDQWTSPKKN